MRWLIRRWDTWVRCHYDCREFWCQRQRLRFRDCRQPRCKRLRFRDRQKHRLRCKGRRKRGDHSRGKSLS
jgi:hypothetical protein